MGPLPARRLLLGAYAALVALCIASFVAAGDLSFGRKPWENFKRTATELSVPSFLNVWFGDREYEYRTDDGRVLRVEDERAVERQFLAAVADAVWTTFKIATLGSALAGLIALPFGLATARNMAAPPLVRAGAKLVLDVARSIHTLVFALIFVGIFGLGATAGVLAIAAHSMGTYGKLYAESIEQVDRPLFEAALSLGATPMQGMRYALWPALVPGALSTHLYVWEYNVRDSTVLGLIGAGGLGLLVSEAVSLFQWGRLATLLIAIVAMVVAFDAVSRYARTRLLGLR